MANMPEGQEAGRLGNWKLPGLPASQPQALVNEGLKTVTRKMSNDEGRRSNEGILSIL
jgi:hypothetical protein